MKMKSLYKGALLAALGLASVPMAQAAYPSGDLLAGFTVSSGNDYIVDLGSVSSILATAASNGGGVNGGGVDTWNLSSALSSYTLSGVSWGVVGAKASPYSAYITTAYGNTPNTIGNSTQGNKVYNAVGAIYADLGTPSSSDVNSWNSQTVNPSLGTQFLNVFDNPNVTGTSSVNGVNSADFYSVLNDGSTETYLGNFSLSSGGVLTLDAVPEPTTCSLIGGVGMLLLTFRNKLRKQA